MVHINSNGASSPRSQSSAQQAAPNYYVTMIDYGRRGREAIVDPEITYSGVVSRVASGEYKDVLFVHHVDETGVEDVTDAVMQDAGVQQAAE